MGPLHVSFEAQNFIIENTSIERQKNRILIQEAKKPRQSMFNLLLAWKAALHNNAMLWFCVHGRASAYHTLMHKKFHNSFIYPTRGALISECFKSFADP